MGIYIDCTNNNKSVAPVPCLVQNVYKIHLGYKITGGNVLVICFLLLHGYVNLLCQSFLKYTLSRLTTGDVFVFYRYVTSVQLMVVN